MKASNETAKINQQVYQTLDFSSNQELELAQQNCVASFNELELKNADQIIWSQKAYEFLNEDCPACVNPSLWQNARCNHQTGLFRLSDQIFQLRGFDMANLTLVLTPNQHWIVFDTLMSIECSRAAIEFADRWFSANHYPTVDTNLAAIVISHSHVDHFGGIRGIFPDFKMDKTVPIYVPSGFTEAAISENLMAGPAMGRRATYQYGGTLAKNATGALSIGIGQGQSHGTVSFELPTHEITQDEKLEIDGLELQFQLTPGTEAPAEMNTFIPQYKALWMAENCTCTMHNIYTLRGAEVRDANNWAKYLLAALHKFGDQAEILFHAHTWPRFVTEEQPDEIKNYLFDQARFYKGLHDQILKAINHGYTINEVEHQLELPTELLNKWYLRPYYGTLSHNAKAVYQRYMGWYDSNPVNLHPLTPTEEAKNLLRYMGDSQAVLEKAQADLTAGNYQWAAKIANIVVFAEPENRLARQICHQALTQLGYQAESGTWRNEYLTGAQEILAGVGAGQELGAQQELIKQLSGEMILNYLALWTTVSDRHLTATIHFTDDWQIVEGVHQSMDSYYRIDYWKGIFTFFALSPEETIPECLFEGHRLDFLQQILYQTAHFSEWNGLFQTTRPKQGFNIVEP